LNKLANVSICLQVVFNPDLAVTLSDKEHSTPNVTLLDDGILWQVEESRDVVYQEVNQVLIFLEDIISQDSCLEYVLSYLSTKTWAYHTQELIKFFLVVQVALS